MRKPIGGLRIVPTKSDLSVDNDIEAPESHTTSKYFGSVGLHSSQHLKDAGKKSLAESKMVVAAW